MICCIRVPQGWGVILPPMGVPGEDGAAQPMPSAPLGMVTHLIAKLRVQLCAARGFSCEQSPSPNTNFLKGKGRKIQGTLPWLSGRFREPGGARSSLQGMVWPKRLEQAKAQHSLAAESLISGNNARNCLDESDEVRSFYPKLRSIFSTLQHSL